MLGLANSKKKVDTTKADTSQSIKQLKEDKMWRENCHRIAKNQIEQSSPSPSPSCF